MIARGIQSNHWRMLPPILGSMAPIMDTPIYISGWRVSWKYFPDCGLDYCGFESLRIHRAGGLNPSGFTGLGV